MANKQGDGSNELQNKPKLDKQNPTTGKQTGADFSAERNARPSKSSQTPPDAGQGYKSVFLKEGGTLWQLSRDTGVPITAIYGANDAKYMPTRPCGTDTYYHSTYPGNYYYKVPVSHEATRASFISYSQRLAESDRLNCGTQEKQKSQAKAEKTSGAQKEKDHSEKKTSAEIKSSHTTAETKKDGGQHPASATHEPAAHEPNHAGSLQALKNQLKLALAHQAELSQQHAETLKNHSGILGGAADVLQNTFGTTTDDKTPIIGGLLSFWGTHVLNKDQGSVKTEAAIDAENQKALKNIHELQAQIKRLESESGAQWQKDLQESKTRIAQLEANAEVIKQTIGRYDEGKSGVEDGLADTAAFTVGGLTAAAPGWNIALGAATKAALKGYDAHGAGRQYTLNDGLVDGATGALDAFALGKGMQFGNSAVKAAATGKLRYIGIKATVTGLNKAGWEIGGKGAANYLKMKGAQTIGKRVAGVVVNAAVKESTIGATTGFVHSSITNAPGMVGDLAQQNWQGAGDRVQNIAASTGSGAVLGGGLGLVGRGTGEGLGGAYRGIVKPGLQRMSTVYGKILPRETDPSQIAAQITQRSTEFKQEQANQQTQPGTDTSHSSANQTQPGADGSHGAAQQGQAGTDTGHGAAQQGQAGTDTGHGAAQQTQAGTDTSHSGANQTQPGADHSSTATTAGNDNSAHTTANQKAASSEAAAEQPILSEVRIPLDGNPATRKAIEAKLLDQMRSTKQQAIITPIEENGKQFLQVTASNKFTDGLSDRFQDSPEIKSAIDTGLAKGKAAHDGNWVDLDWNKVNSQPAPSEQVIGSGKSGSEAKPEETSTQAGDQKLAKQGSEQGTESERKTLFVPCDKASKGTVMGRRTHLLQEKSIDKGDVPFVWDDGSATGQSGYRVTGPNKFMDEYKQRLETPADQNAPKFKTEESTTPVEKTEPASKPVKAEKPAKAAKPKKESGLSQFINKTPRSERQTPAADANATNANATAEPAQESTAAITSAEQSTSAAQSHEKQTTTSAQGADNSAGEQKTPDAGNNAAVTHIEPTKINLPKHLIGGDQAVVYLPAVQGLKDFVEGNSGARLAGSKAEVAKLWGPAAEVDKALKSIEHNQALAEEIQKANTPEFRSKTEAKVQEDFSFQNSDVWKKLKDVVAVNPDQYDAGKLADNAQWTYVSGKDFPAPEVDPATGKITKFLVPKHSGEQEQIAHVLEYLRKTDATQAPKGPEPSTDSQTTVVPQNHSLKRILGKHIAGETKTKAADNSANATTTNADTTATAADPNDQTTAQTAEEKKTLMQKLAMFPEAFKKGWAKHKEAEEARKLEAETRKAAEANKPAQPKDAATKSEEAAEKAKQAAAEKQRLETEALERSKEALDAQIHSKSVLSKLPKVVSEDKLVGYSFDDFITNKGPNGPKRYEDLAPQQPNPRFDGSTHQKFADNTDLVENAKGIGSSTGPVRRLQYHSNSTDPSNEIQEWYKDKFVLEMKDGQKITFVDSEEPTLTPKDRTEPKDADRLSKKDQDLLQKAQDYKDYLDSTIPSFDKALDKAFDNIHLKYVGDLTIDTDTPGNFTFSVTSELPAPEPSPAAGETPEIGTPPSRGDVEFDQIKKLLHQLGLVDGQKCEWPLTRKDNYVDGADGVKTRTTTFSGDAETARTLYRKLEAVKARTSAEEAAKSSGNGPDATASGDSSNKAPELSEQEKFDKAVADYDATNKKQVEHITLNRVAGEENTFQFEIDTWNDNRAMTKPRADALQRIVTGIKAAYPEVTVIERTSKVGALSKAIFKGDPDKLSEVAQKVSSEQAKDLRTWPEAKQTAEKANATGKEKTAEQENEVPAKSSQNGKGGANKQEAPEPIVNSAESSKKSESSGATAGSDTNNKAPELSEQEKFERAKAELVAKQKIEVEHIALKKVAGKQDEYEFYVAIKERGSTQPREISEQRTSELDVLHDSINTAFKPGTAKWSEGKGGYKSGVNFTGSLETMQKVAKIVANEQAKDPKAWPEAKPTADKIEAEKAEADKIAAEQKAEANRLASEQAAKDAAVRQAAAGQKETKDTTSQQTPADKLDAAKEFFKAMSQGETQAPLGQAVSEAQTETKVDTNKSTDTSVETTPAERMSRWNIALTNDEQVVQIKRLQGTDGLQQTKLVKSVLKAEGIPQKSVMQLGNQEITLRVGSKAKTIADLIAQEMDRNLQARELQPKAPEHQMESDPYSGVKWPESKTIAWFENCKLASRVNIESSQWPALAFDYSVLDISKLLNEHIQLAEKNNQRTFESWTDPQTNEIVVHAPANVLEEFVDSLSKDVYAETQKQLELEQRQARQHELIQQRQRQRERDRADDFDMEL